MKCCGSLTTSTAPNRVHAPENANTAERSLVAERVNAMLFAQVLKPLAKALGPFGDLAVESVAEATFVRTTR